MNNDEPKLTIFVSSMIGPLWDERAIVEEAIRTGIPLARTWVFERAPASSEEITESYLARVRECDICLLILGEDISDPVKAEYRTAVECDKPRLCFVQEGVERTRALEEFLPTLQTDVKYAAFGDEAGLRREVLRAVRQELVQGYKRYRLGESERAQLVASIAALPPCPPDYFVGRREILDELKAGLATGSAQAITALQGMGGIGKTATARQLALEMEADFPGGIFWADLPRHGGDPSPVLAAWATMCGHDVASLGDPQTRAQAVRGMLGARQQDKGRLLAVLDDVREGWLEGAQALKAALPPGVPLVLTTRDEELAYALGAEVRRLDALPIEDALALSSRLAGADVVEAEPLEARALAERVGRLPLALELAGKLAARYARKPGWRLATLRARVEAKAVEALKLRGHPGLAATFAISYEALQAEQQRMFRWLGVFAPGPITVAAVAGMLKGEERAAGVALDELVGLALVEWGETAEVYRLHPLLAEYAKTLLEEMGEERAAREAHLAYYLAYAKANAEIDLAAHNRLEAELANLMAAAEWAAEVGEHQAVEELGAALYVNSRFLDVRGRYREAVRLLTWSVAAAREIGDRQNTGIHLRHLGTVYYCLGQVEQAIGRCQEALAIFNEVGDQRGKGHCLGNLGLFYYDLGQVEQAIEYHQQALVIAREIGDRRDEGMHLGNLGAACAGLGQVEQAIEYHQQALVIAREISDRRNEAIWLLNLGGDYAYIGQVEQAIECYQQALVIAREIGDRRNEGLSLHNLGWVYTGLEQVEQAIECYQQALAIFREIGDQRNEGRSLNNLGWVYAGLEQVEQAIECYQQALAIFREIGDRKEEGNSLDSLGTAYDNLGEVEKAIEYYTQALQITRELGDRQREETVLGKLRGKGLDLDNLGNNYFAQGQVEKAIEYHQQALAIFREIGDRKEEGSSLGSLGTAYDKLGQVEKAIEYYTQALQIARELGNRREEETVLGRLRRKGLDLDNLGNNYFAQGQVEKAIEYYRQALAIFREIGDRREEGSALDRLGMAYWHLGQMEQVFEYCQKALDAAHGLGDRSLENAALCVLGIAYWSLGQVEEAIEYYRRALEFACEIGDQRLEGGLLHNLGLVYYGLGQVEKAIEYYRRALEIAHEIGHREFEGNHLNNLGLAYANLGQMEKAIEYYAQALEVAREIGNRRGEGSYLVNLGLTYYRLGEVERAQSAWRRACQMLRQFIGQVDPAYAFAGAVLGLAISNSSWSDPAAREKLLSPVLSAYRAALTLSTAPGIVRGLLHEDIRPLREMGIEGLEPVVTLLEEALAGGNEQARRMGSEGS